MNDGALRRRMSRDGEIVWEGLTPSVEDDQGGEMIFIWRNKGGRQRRSPETMSSFGKTHACNRGFSALQFGQVPYSETRATRSAYAMDKKRRQICHLAHRDQKVTAVRLGSLMQLTR